MPQAHDDCSPVKSATPVLPNRFFSRRRTLCCGLLAGMSLLSGCPPKVEKPDQPADASLQQKYPTAQIKNDDDCANRLHDIVEPLYIYYVKNHRLPNHLEELRELRGFENLELTCPVSKLPYVYNPIGIITLDNQPRMICYDAVPSHYSLPHIEMRWAISITEPSEPNGPLVAKVVAVPESNFTLKPRR